jgi:hypothetical protein
VIIGLLVLAANAKAGPVTTISFDALQTGEDVLNYYNGGFGSMGSGPGPSLGVIFLAGWIVGPPSVFQLFLLGIGLLKLAAPRPRDHR